VEGCGKPIRVIEQGDCSLSCASDVYFLLWRLVPYEMVKAGFKYTESLKFDYEYGNVETTTYSRDEKNENSNKQSRGGKTDKKTKILPGISPFIFGRFLVQNSVFVTLPQVWPDPVDLVDLPTIFVKPTDEMKGLYNNMIHTFERAIDSREDGHKLYLPMIETGISYMDNPFTYPDVCLKTDDGYAVIWEADHMNPNQILPKEKKLQEVITTEISEGRASIVFVKDTGSTKEGRDVRPRLKHVLEQVPGAKVAILDTNTCKTYERSDWIKNKVLNEGYNIIISSTKLVEVGLDLLFTPSIHFYQFGWSLYTMLQAARRAWRIGQTDECRIFYYAYEDTYQAYMAKLIAQKSKATKAINGDAGSDGLTAMLGGEEDLMTMLIKSVKEGTKLQGSAEEWSVTCSLLKIGLTA